MQADTTALDANNVQGVGLAGFRKDHQEMLFVRFKDAKSGRKLLKHLEPDVASHHEVTAFNELFSEIRARRGKEVIEATWMAVMLSARGLETLEADLSGLPEGEGKTAFLEGMSHRAEQIGDTREPDAPANWEKAFRPDAPGIHALIILAADRVDDLERHLDGVRQRIEDTNCEVVFSERGRTLEGSLRGHEHFGFKDGISSLQ